MAAQGGSRKETNRRLRRRHRRRTTTCRRRARRRDRRLPLPWSLYTSVLPSCRHRRHRRRLRPPPPPPERSTAISSDHPLHGPPLPPSFSPRSVPSINLAYLHSILHRLRPTSTISRTASPSRLSSPPDPTPTSHLPLHPCPSKFPSHHQIQRRHVVCILIPHASPPYALRFTLLRPTPFPALFSSPIEPLPCYRPSNLP